jgi:hypothetical protein
MLRWADVFSAFSQGCVGCQTSANLYLQHPANPPILTLWLVIRVGFAYWNILTRAPCHEHQLHSKLDGDPLIDELDGIFHTSFPAARSLLSAAFVSVSRKFC